MANNQSVRRHLDAFTRGRITGKLEEGRSVTSVAVEFELLTASFHDFGDNFKIQEQLSGVQFSQRDRYCNEILLPYVRLLEALCVCSSFFMDDNAPCHRTVATEQLFESRRLAARTLPPVTIRELRLALQDEWAAMPQQLIDSLILSMGRRCEACLAVRGDHILLKTGCFLLDTHRRDVLAFSRIALHATSFSIKHLFYPSDFSFLVSVVTLHMFLRIGDLTVLNVLIWKAFVQCILKNRLVP
ncbi:hypothetical protein TNCV_3357431 [Trichonephila clavipes]|nr:hypothetical protein TNCV_3357431 [Trichonephila clavipes]